VAETTAIKDKLVYFLQLAQATLNEAISASKAEMQYLNDIDRLFMDFLPNMGSMKPSHSGLLVLNSHASLRAASGLCLSGQLLPAYMSIRGGIESMLYANAMVRNPALKDVWLSRHDGVEQKEMCIRQFSIRKMFNYLAETSGEEFCQWLREDYEGTIDFGAHPNCLSIMRSMRIQTLDSGGKFAEFAYIHGYRDPATRQAMAACADVQLKLIRVALDCCPKHPQLPELNQRWYELDRFMPQFIRQLGFELGKQDCGDASKNLGEK